jgi:iron complex outermembrane receptor protein
MHQRSLSARLLCGSGLALSLLAANAPSQAAPAAAAGVDAAESAATPPDEKADYGVRVEELTVVGASPAAAAAPVKASLEATEPQAIVTREAIDQFIPQTADYTEIVLLTPSVSGISFNGPGFYEAKTTIRGFKDGEYNVTYDGIPFGDTNDPTHHSTSFFPAATIGAVVVDRGPGQAGQLGQANFGGSVNLFSPEVGEELGGSVSVTGGSWDTLQGVAKLNTGAIDRLHGARALVDVSALHTSGYLQNSGAQGANALVRAVVPVTDNWNVTLYSTLNYTRVYQDDNNGATLVQVQQYGKDFALNNDPTTPFYTGYNTVKKHSSLSYVRLSGDLTPQTHVEDTAYTYYYSNHTLSPEDVTGTASPSKTIPAGHIPGYTKLNYYHVYGNILHLSQELPFDVTAKAGVWLETSKTKRARYDYDLTTQLPNLKEKCPTLQAGVVCNRGAASNVNYVQGSTWDQYQPFLDVEWRPLPGLTLTPGIKYVHFKRDLDSPVNQGSGTQFHGSATWSKTLYFLTANYKVMENWSAYAQYATGFLIPPLSTLQVQKPDSKDEQPQTSKNYQLGTVFHGGRFTLDGDVYLIRFRNKFQNITVTSGPQAGETVFYNLGGATYKGVEAQGTFAVTPEAFVFANASRNIARAQGGSTTIAGVPVTLAGGTQIANAPKWTAAAGVIWKPEGWSFSVTDKVVGPQWAAEGEPSNFRIGTYSNVDLTVVRNLGRLRLEAAIYNLFDSQKLTKLSPGGKVFNTLTAADQYYYQPERSVQVSARVSF